MADNENQIDFEGKSEMESVAAVIELMSNRFIKLEKQFLELTRAQSATLISIRSSLQITQILLTIEAGKNADIEDGDLAEFHDGYLNILEERTKESIQEVLENLEDRDPSLAAKLGELFQNLHSDTDLHDS